MLMTIVGTVWHCEETEVEMEGYTIKIAETLPAYYTKEGALRGQTIQLSLEHTEELEMGQPYRITARVTGIQPTQDGDDICIAGTVLEAELVELKSHKD